MRVLVAALLSAAAAATARPELRAGYDCTAGCGGQACTAASFRLELLDALQWHPGLVAHGNGSTSWKPPKRPGSVSSCDPARSRNNSALMAAATLSGVQNILSLHAPMVTTSAYNASSEVYLLLSNKSRRLAAAGSACATAQAGGFDGVSLDFEGSWRSNEEFRWDLTAFTVELTAACTALGLSLSSAVSHDPTYTLAEDLENEAAATSAGLLMMTYDYLFVTASGPNSLSRPNAPLYPYSRSPVPASPNNNVNSSIHWALDHGVPPEKLLMCIAWYGREVPTVSGEIGSKINVSASTPPPKGGRVQTDYAYQQPLAEQRASDPGTGVQWDTSSATPWYAFKDPVRPWLWWQGFYDDACSLRYKYEMVKRLGLRGILIWDLNGCTVAEAPAMWDLLNASFGPRSPA